MRFYWNGNKIDSTVAKQRVIQKVLLAGYDTADFESIWELAYETGFEGENARDQIAELSGYYLEMIPDEIDDTLDD